MCPVYVHCVNVRICIARMKMQSSLCASYIIVVSEVDWLTLKNVCIYHSRTTYAKDIQRMAKKLHKEKARTSMYVSSDVAGFPGQYNMWNQ